MSAEKVATLNQMKLTDQVPQGKPIKVPDGAARPNFTPAAPQPVANPSYGQPQNYPNQNYPQQSYPQNQPVYPSGAPQFPPPGQNNGTQTPPPSQPAWPR